MKNQDNGSDPAIEGENLILSNGGGSRIRFENRVRRWRVIMMSVQRKQRHRDAQLAAMHSIFGQAHLKSRKLRSGIINARGTLGTLRYDEKDLRFSDRGREPKP